MFPMVSDAHARAVEPISILRKSVLLTFALCLIVAIVFLIVPNIVVGSLYGQEYLAADGTLQILGFAMVFFAIASLFMIYGLATDYRMLIWILAAATIMEILLIFLFHQSAEAIASDLLVSGIVTTALSTMYLRTKGGKWVGSNRGE
jgi:O-antigen/teichoic acid export membrane protein